MRTALPLLLEEKADIYLFLGDVCGYYFDVIECIDILREIPGLLSIRGNHDDIFLHALESMSAPSEYGETYGPSLDTCIKQDKSEHDKISKFLDACLTCYTNGKTGIFAEHICTAATNGYLYPDSQLPDKSAYAFNIFGHTHYPMLRHGNGAWFLNPGSIGQPRDGAGPSYLTLIPSSGKIVLRRFLYDTAPLLLDMQKMRGVPTYLIDVIRRIS